MKNNFEIYLGLVHHPIKNKRDQIVTTSVTNLDIHDIARSCKTYGIKKYFIITPLEEQQKLVNRILGHWKEDKSLVYNPDRQNALSIACLKNTIKECMDEIEEIENRRPIQVVTGANFETYDGTENDLIKLRNIDKVPILLLFGTGWGLHATALDHADYRLVPLKSKIDSGYNHLSVRSAVAIYLDRLRGGL